MREFCFIYSQVPFLSASLHSLCTVSLKSGIPLHCAQPQTSPQHCCVYLIFTNCSWSGFAYEAIFPPLTLITFLFSHLPFLSNFVFDNNKHVFPVFLVNCVPRQDAAFRPFNYNGKCNNMQPVPSVQRERRSFPLVGTRRISFAVFIKVSYSFIGLLMCVISVMLSSFSFIDLLSGTFSIVYLNSAAFIYYSHKNLYLKLLSFLCLCPR